MKLLLTSGGVSNPSIEHSLASLLGKPIAESSALCIPTAGHALRGGPRLVWQLLQGQDTTPLVELGWKSMGVLELTALPTLGRDRWLPAVQGVDALLVAGGDPLYLHYWMRESGLADVLATLHDTVYVGVSAGSMVMAPRIGEEFVVWKQQSGTDETLGIVEFALFPHLDHPMLPTNTMAHAERWAANLSIPGYAIDDHTAVQWVDGMVDVISEGHWRRFDP